MGFILTLLALITLGQDLYTWAGSHAFGISSLAEAWMRINTGSLSAFQSFIEDISPALWRSVFLPVFNLPAFAVLGLPGLILMLVCRPR